MAAGTLRTGRADRAVLHRLTVRTLPSDAPDLRRHVTLIVSIIVALEDNRRLVSVQENPWILQPFIGTTFKVVDHLEADAAALEGSHCGGC